MIKELKIYEAITCNENENIVNVAKIIKEKGARQIYVIDEEEKPKGIISVVDINNKVVAEEKPYKNIKAKDIMNSPVDCVDINQEEEFAMKIMMERKTYACLVTEKGKVKGVVDYKSVVDNIIKTIKETKCR